MNESMLQYLDLKDLPIEFSKLGESINFLITKIQTFINYRKELYVGTAHELKTPLAVMRLKNQITLMKHKQQDKIKETLQQNIESIDTLNSMIHNILEYGRAEGAQFEQPQRINLIRLMASKAEEYELLAQSQNRNFMYHFSVSDFRINVQPLLFMQIFQNFIQNALRFTPENALVRIETRMDEENFIVEIIDEGIGIDESKDLFAPFQRSQESTGAGLGLFLAQNAAQSMGVIINIKNRPNDEKGAIASIHFPLNRFLLKD
jgi:two-component system OmpR family sensor kinase